MNAIGAGYSAFSNQADADRVLFLLGSMYPDHEMRYTEIRNDQGLISSVKVLYLGLAQIDLPLFQERLSVFPYLIRKYSVDGNMVSVQLDGEL